ncbi:MAG TPA: LuxR C-terminal-related transcriptional regulator [Burkholderiaceae bacterium]|nr:LuxR C-terminal-related transcriptional regulator [Burkholderiaceae bacterium]
MTSRWRLTPAEARVLQRLVAGCEPADIAAELTIARSTLHSHVQALLVKSGCRRQVDLVRVVLGG